MYKKNRRRASQARSFGESFRWLATLALVVSVCASAAEPPKPKVSVWITTSDHAMALKPSLAAAFDNGKRLPLHIDVDADQRFQSMIGFGASITDASAWLIQNKLNPTQREALLKELFGPAPGAMRLSSAPVALAPAV